MLDAMDAGQRREVSPDWLARAEQQTEPDPWTLGFAIHSRETARLIGRCGFKGPPDPDGHVEIAYGVEPRYEGNGYAAEAAAALVQFAFSDSRVRVVRAHTVSNSGASARVLLKCRFGCVGQVVDPEDGLVWRWERPRTGDHA